MIGFQYSNYAVNPNDVESTSESKFDDIDAERYNIPGCKVILVNLSHCNQTPKSHEASFRILGGFFNMEQCRDHIEHTQLREQNLNLFAYELHQGFVICQNALEQTDPETQITKKKTLTSAHTKRRHLADIDFQHSKRDGKMSQED